MSALIAALPMYDWPERRAEVDIEWVAIRDRFRAAGIEAPEELTRDYSDLHELWRRPNLLFAQTCWGPLGQGLLEHVQIVGQPSYDGIEGGEGELYSSAIVMRAPLPSPLWGGSDGKAGRGGGLQGMHPSKVSPQPGPFQVFAETPTPPLRVDPPHKGEGKAALPLNLLRNARFAFNSTDSMSGILALAGDLAACGESLDIFSERLETGGHRISIKAVAEGKADVAAIDCRSWQLAQRYEPAAQELRVVGWTAKRKGLPYITSKTTPADVVGALREIIGGLK